MTGALGEGIERPIDFSYDACWFECAECSDRVVMTFEDRVNGESRACCSGHDVSAQTEHPALTDLSDIALDPAEIERLHPELGWDWNNSQEGHLWVLAHRLDDLPAVVSATAPLRALRNRRGSGTAVDLFARVADATDPAKALETALWLLRDSPEWLVDPADITAHGSTPVSARVDDDLLYFISGETVDVFREQLRSGHWGERGASAHEGDRPWHPFEQVWARLSRDRQSELGELVGVPITSVLAANAREAAELVAEA